MKEFKVIWVDNKTYNLILEQVKTNNEFVIETIGQDPILVEGVTKCK